MTTEIKLIHNKEKEYYKVTVNGEDHYTPFTYISDNPDEETDARRMAKAAAFDECIIAQQKGKITVSYLGY